MVLKNEDRETKRGGKWLQFQYLGNRSRTEVRGPPGWPKTQWGEEEAPSEMCVVASTSMSRALKLQSHGNRRSLPLVWGQMLVYRNDQVLFPPPGWLEPADHDIALGYCSRAIHGTLLHHDDNGLPSGTVINPQLNDFSSKSCLVMPSLCSNRRVAKTECLQQKALPTRFSVCSVSLFFLHSLIAPQVIKPNCAECQENLTQVPKEKERQTATGRNDRET